MKKNEPLSCTILEKGIVSRRILDAPRELVFKAWTEADHLKLWWGPKGFTNTFHEFDPRPGGNWKFVMHGPDGKDYENHSVFVEILKPERILFEHVSQHHYIATILFEEVENRTRVDFKMVFDTSEEFDRIKEYIAVGNEQNFDRLEEVLARMMG
ncbi:SRPBCC family protein [Leptospira sp. 201903070]|uniref:SRPBCC family protein n=1 Tax=Leptospira ainlahdjerensis TaxID=2810033 RepID=A0ABS2U7B6_9LEPT|nr:SRPBCC family protein [Leptospira ainlahdjerensis]MBM9575863.1 SRPBCC family protein [Leptospira ainlahdjerensis]